MTKRNPSKLLKKLRKKQQNTKTLLQEVCSIQNIRTAWKQLNKTNSTSYGLSGETLKEFQDNLESNLQSISTQLRKGTYVFTPYRAVAILKNDKRDPVPEYRPIKVPEIRDRVVLKAISIIISEQLQEKFQLNNPASFAYQKKLGVEDAIRRMVKLYGEGNKVILESDIEKFFDKVNLEQLLINKIFPALKDRSLDKLIQEGLNQEIGNKDTLDEFKLSAFQNTSGGIPQGSSLSPLLSNVALAEFDQRMINDGYGLVRYADDFIVMCKSKEDAEKAFAIAKEEIEEKLGLHLYDFADTKKPSKILMPDRDNFSFLSIRFDGKHVYPTKEKVKELKDKVKTLCVLQNWDKDSKVKIDNTVLVTLKRVDNLLCGWLAAFSFTDVDRNFVEIDEYINKELCAVFRQMGWDFKTTVKSKTKTKYSGSFRDCLSDEQRRYSGVHTCVGFFEKVMSNRNKIIL